MRWNANKRRATIKEIAGIVGLDRNTVSKSVKSGVLDLSNICSIVGYINDVEHKHRVYAESSVIIGSTQN